MSIDNDEVRLSVPMVSAWHAPDPDPAASLRYCLEGANDTIASAERTIAAAEALIGRAVGVIASQRLTIARYEAAIAAIEGGVMRRRTFDPGAGLYPPRGTFGDAQTLLPSPAEAVVPPTGPPRSRGWGRVGALPRPVRGFIARCQQAAAARREVTS